MAIPNLKTKLKQNLKKDIENEGQKGNDPRFLNYFDLKTNEKMTILFVPDVNGEFWTKFSKHGPQLKIKGADGKDIGVRGAGSINCSFKSSGEDCPACLKGFGLFNEAKESGDKELKEEGKKWMPRDYTLVSCIVLDSPFEITKDSKGNEVKLMYLPHAVGEKIKQAITEGIINEDELCATPFIIKKTENAGGRASYEHSYFARQCIDDSELEFLEDLVVEQYDYTDLDVVPSATTTEEVEEWLEKAEEAYEKALAGAKGGRKSKADADTDEDDDRSVRKQRSPVTRKSYRDEPEPELNDGEFDGEAGNSEEESSAEEAPEQEEKTTSTKDRLAALRNRRK